MKHAHRSHPRRARTTFLMFGAAVALAWGGGGGGGGCARVPNPDLAGPAYPEREQTRTLDIQVVREETVIRLTNTTARGFGKCRLWMNRWYSLAIDKFDVGQTLELDLGAFRDEHGEAFEAGGFFAIKKPDPLVMAQLETGEEMLGLVVVSAPED